MKGAANDCGEFAVTLLEHFPQAADTDVRLTWDLVKSLDAGAVGRAIERHREELGSKVFRPDPRRIAQLSRAAPAGASPAAERTAKELAAERYLATQIESQRADNLRRLRALPTEELERLKAAALAELGGAIASRFAGRGVLECEALQAFVICQLEREEQAAREAAGVTVAGASGGGS